MSGRGEEETISEETPPGFRLCPTDEQLINSYLKPWITGTLPERCNGIIMEKQLYGEDAATPWHMFHNENEWQQPQNAIKNNVYAFTKLIKHKSRVARIAGCGTWHGETTKTSIVNSSGTQVIGIKKMLTFQINNNYPSSTHNLGHWIMHEYSIPNLDSDYVVCEITRDFSKPIKKCPAAAKKSLSTTTTNRKRTHTEKSCSISDQLPSKRRKSVMLETGTTSRIIKSCEEKFYQNLDKCPLPDRQQSAEFFKDSIGGSVQGNLQENPTEAQVSGDDQFKYLTTSVEDYLENPNEADQEWFQIEGCEAAPESADADFLLNFDEILNFEIPENFLEDLTY